MNNAAARVGLARRCLTFFATEWLEDVGPFDVALVLLGVNDAAKGLATEFKTHFSSIVSTLAGLSFKPALILGKPLPLLSREFVSSSQMISTFVEEVGHDQGTFFSYDGWPALPHYTQAPQSSILPLENIPTVWPT